MANQIDTTLDPHGAVARIIAAVQAAGDSATLATAIVASGITDTAIYDAKDQEVKGTFHPEVALPVIDPGSSQEALKDFDGVADQRYGFPPGTYAGHYGLEELENEVWPDPVLLGFPAGYSYDWRDRSDGRLCVGFAEAVMAKVGRLPVNGERITAAERAQLAAAGNVAADAAGAAHQAELYAWDLAHPSQAPQSERGKAEAAARSAVVLKLLGGRFEVTIPHWEEPAGRSGRKGVGQAVPMLPGLGWFWFFAPDLPEVFVTVMDQGAAGHSVKVNASTDTGFTVVVKDTVSGKSWQHINPAGNLMGVIAWLAFPA